MSDRLWFSLAAVLAVLMIGFATIWPQGFGDRSPGPFGHAPLVAAKPKTSTPASRAPLIGLDGFAQTPPSSAEPDLRPAQ